MFIGISSYVEDWIMVKFVGFIGAIGMMPVVAQVDAASTMEKMAKGTTQTVLAVVVICLALALMQVYKLHRKDALDSKEELKQEFERHMKEQSSVNDKLSKLLVDNTSAMNMLATIDQQLKDAIYHLARVVEGNGDTADKVRKVGRG